MVDARRTFGNAAEDEAAAFLIAKGFRLLDRQYRSRFGEVDLVMEDGNELVFVEVKARESTEFGYPEESVTQAKLRKMAATAAIYVDEHRVAHRPYRFDVVAIEYHLVPPRFTHIVAVG